MNLYTQLILVSVSLLLTGCDDKAPLANKGKDLVNIKHVVEVSLANMVSISGGTFLMGDFGPLVDEKLPYSPNQDDKVLHQVTLSDFKISKYKVTYQDYDAYSLAIGAEKIPGPRIWLKLSPKLRDANIPVTVTWQQAKDYCLWLGKSSGKKVDLPTEAQWEYAARAQGKYLPYPTDNGDYEPGRNVASDEQIETMMKYFMVTYPIGKYPANPLGLYDMGVNGREWMNDWYAADYYQASKEMKDPTGPDSGDKKVMRGLTRGDFHSALTMYRQSYKPIPIDINDYKQNGLNPDFTFRCVINE
ncbi:formylglycine-generating enzyme family protein [Serratia oryzae]|uniref:Sulfatase modifying factor 1 n=1 Tax=Serratia oryzae TaxID=2034155 RepID=A0A1S8CMW6_9GAMM|nr:SUMF1/EgtB/PvdO family nonheme iron enzyme [Serratia oryzae]OMQ24598.1 sulfatase modifying factor 1 [Serratia oryzae]